MMMRLMTTMKMFGERPMTEMKRKIMTMNG
jgi:hypothetical protein